MIPASSAQSSEQSVSLPRQIDRVETTEIATLAATAAAAAAKGNGGNQPIWWATLLAAVIGASGTIFVAVGNRNATRDLEVLRITRQEELDAIKTSTQFLLEQFKSTRASELESLKRELAEISSRQQLLLQARKQLYPELIVAAEGVASSAVEIHLYSDLADESISVSGFIGALDGYSKHLATLNALISNPGISKPISVASIEFRSAALDFFYFLNNTPKADLRAAALTGKPDAVGQAKGRLENYKSDLKKKSDHLRKSASQLVGLARDEFNHGESRA